MSIHDRPYGVGLAYRNFAHRRFLDHADEIDLIEVPTEDYLVRARTVSRDPQCKLLREATQCFPSLAHGISLSIGSVEPLDVPLLQRTAALLDEFGMRCFSEHLTFHRMDGADLTLFQCLPFEDVAADWIAANYNAARAVLGRNFALENVSYYYAVPDCRYDEPGFLCEVLDRCDCTLLLDVTNIFNNCTNHNQDPIEYIHRLPRDRISQIHLAGGHYEDGFLVDSHSAAVMDPVWDFFEETLRHTGAEVVILERDTNVEPFADLMGDVRKAREIFYRHRPAEPPGESLDVGVSPDALRVRPPDALAPEYANLRNFQRALVREITDDHFRLLARMDTASARRLYPLDDDWLGRWRGCSQDRINYLARTYKSIQDSGRYNDEQYRRWEWQQWARTTA
jgi:uncharacterized protein (UPF0276 family)